jgi:hypothetical protein
MPEQAHSKLFTRPAVLVKKVHIIASSTERKRLLVPTDLRLGHSERLLLRNALSAVANCYPISLRLITAIDLHVGDHWSIIKM